MYSTTSNTTSRLLPSHSFSLYFHFFHFYFVPSLLPQFYGCCEVCTRARHTSNRSKIITRYDPLCSCSMHSSFIARRECMKIENHSVFRFCYFYIFIWPFRWILLFVFIVSSHCLSLFLVRISFVLSTYFIYFHCRLVYTSEIVVRIFPNIMSSSTQSGNRRWCVFQCVVSHCCLVIADDRAVNFKVFFL